MPIKYFAPPDKREAAVWAVWVGSAVAVALLTSRVVPIGEEAGVARPFAATVLGFETFVVAIAIPLALNLIGGLHAKYASSVMRETVLSVLPMRRLAVMAFSTITLLIFLLSGVVPTTSALEWLAFFGVMSTVLLFLLFMDSVIHVVMSEPMAAVSMMGQRLSDAVSDPETDFASDASFSSPCQGLGDVLSYVAGNGVQGPALSACLGHLADAALAVASLRASDPERYAMRVSRPSLRARGADGMAAAMSLFPGVAMPGFSMPVDQVARAFRAACDGGNDDAGRECVSALASVLSVVAASPGSGPETVAVLSRLHDMSGYALASGRTPLAAAAAHGWYFRLLFPEGGGAGEYGEAAVRAMTETAFAGTAASLRADAAADVLTDYCRHACGWMPNADTLSARKWLAATLDALSFSIASYAVASGDPEAAVSMAVAGEAAESDPDGGRAVLPTTPEAVLATWASASGRGTMDRRGPGGAEPESAKRRTASLLLARCRARTGRLPGPPAGPHDATLLAMAARESSGGPDDVLASPDRELAERSLLEVAEALDAAGCGADYPDTGTRSGGHGLTSQMRRVLAG